MSEMPHWSSKADNKRKTTGKAYAYRYTLNNDKAIGLTWARVGHGKLILSDFLDAGMREYMKANGIDFDNGVPLDSVISPPAIAKFRTPTIAAKETDPNKIKANGKKYSYRYTTDNAAAIKALEELVGVDIAFIDLMAEAMRCYCAAAGVDWDEGTLIGATSDIPPA